MDPIITCFINTPPNHSSERGMIFLWKSFWDAYIFYFELYSKPCQTSKINHFAEVVNTRKPFTIFAESSILDVWQCSEYVCVIRMERHQNDIYSHHLETSPLICYAKQLTGFHIIVTDGILVVFVVNFECIEHIIILPLTNFKPILHIYTCWEREKTRGFLKFSGGIKMEHWLKTD